MQKQNFDRMMEESKTITDTHPQKGFSSNVLMADLRSMPADQVKALHTMPKEVVREIIRINEEPISDLLALKIKQYIIRSRDRGASESAIAKAIKKKFGITVI
jgi:hypothetical protein